MVCLMRQRGSVQARLLLEHSLVLHRRGDKEALAAGVVSLDTATVMDQLAQVRVSRRIFILLSSSAPEMSMHALIR